MLTSGTTLIAKDTLRPECFHLEAGSYPDDWMSVRHNLTPNALDNKLATEGWTYFFMAGGSIRSIAFGFDRAKMINAALKRVITNVKLQKCNCLEIDAVGTHSFLGIPYMSVSAHARHIQKGMVFSGQ